MQKPLVGVWGRYFTHYLTLTPALYSYLYAQIKYHGVSNYADLRTMEVKGQVYVYCHEKKEEK